MYEDEYEYQCFTTVGSFKFTAPSDRDALRLALYYCWRDNEDFQYVKRVGKSYTLGIVIINNGAFIRTT